MQPITPTMPHINNQGSIILSRQEAQGLKTGDVYYLNGLKVTILLVLEINNKNTEIVYYIPPDTKDNG